MNDMNIYIGQTMEGTMEHFEAAADDGINLKTQPPGTKLTLKDMEDLEYQVTIVNPDQSKATIVGGKFFPRPTEVVLMGSRQINGNNLHIGHIVRNHILEISTPAEISPTGIIEMPVKHIWMEPDESGHI